MAAEVNTSPSFSAGVPHSLFQTDVYGPSIVRSRNNYAIGAGGNEFIINSIVDSKQPINVVVGWNPQ